MANKYILMFKNGKVKELKNFTKGKVVEDFTYQYMSFRGTESGIKTIYVHSKNGKKYKISGMVVE